MDKGPVLFLLGAGASVDSGLKTYRGQNGYYSKWGDNHPMNITVFEKSPEKTWNHIDEILSDLTDIRGLTYDRIQDIINQHSDSLVVTQNIDGIARSLTNTTLVELHGCALFKKCKKDGFLSNDKICEICGNVMRPNVVLYGESPDKEDFRTIFTFIAKRRPRTCYIIGTTLQFGYLHMILNKSRHIGAKIIHVNPDIEYEWHSRRENGKLRKKPELLIKEL